MQLVAECMMEDTERSEKNDGGRFGLLFDLRGLGECAETDKKKQTIKIVMSCKEGHGSGYSDL
jgi:hypothetical protein